METAAPRKRRRWIWLVLLALLALGGWIAVRTMLQPERLSEFLLQQARAATGLEITLAQPADVGFWPDLHLVLTGLSARAPGNNKLILRSERVEVVLPWSTLRGETFALRELRLASMELDANALFAWIDSRAELGPPAPLRLPRLEAGLFLSDSVIRHDDQALSELDLELSRLREGQPSTAAMSAVLTGPERRLPFNVNLEFTPHQDGSEIRFEPIALVWRETAQSEPWLRSDGGIALDHPRSLRVDLANALPRWPADWPALPFPADESDQEVTISFDYQGTPQWQGAARLRLSRADESIVASLKLGDVLAWMSAPQRHPLPPITGTAEAERLQFGGVEMRGVSVRIDEDSDDPTAAKK